MDKPTEQTADNSEDLSNQGLGLSVPERKAPAANAFLLNPKATEDWFNALPMANVGETARLIFKALVDFNRMQCPDLQRAKTIERFREPVEYLISNLRRHYMDASFPLKAKSRKVAALSRELYGELAIAYKIVIESMLHGLGEKFDRKLLVIALHRAMHYLGQVVYQSALVYEPYPKLVWRELHTLYAYAFQNQVDQQPVRMGNGDETSSTIADSYKRILLMALASPYQLRQRDTEALYRQLREWSALVHLSSPRPEKDLSGVFVLNLWADSPPSHASIYPDKLNQRCRLLETSALLQRLQEDFDELASQDNINRSSGTSMSSNTLRQLLRNWSHAPRREYVRTKLNFELQVAVGLGVLFAKLQTNAPAAPSPSPAPQSNEDPFGWLHSEELERSMILPGAATAGKPGSGPLQLTPLGSDLERDSFFPDSLMAPSMDMDSRGLWPASQQASMRPAATTPLKTLNESAGGYCISWQSSNAPGIKVGELIGIQSTSHPHQYGVGVARWLKQVPSSGLQVGMQSIAPNCSAVTTRVAQTGHQKRQKSPSHNGLLLPAVPASGQSPSLIVSAMAYQVGDTLWVSGPNGDQLLRLSRLVEETGSFSQFQFKNLSEEEETLSDPHDGEDQDFDHLWTNI